MIQWKLVILWILLLLASTPDQSMASSTLPSCKESWSKLISQNLHKYDYAKYAHPSAQGNLGYQQYIKTLQREGCLKEWTILIFMAADAPDIEPYAKWDIYEMESGFKHNRNYAGSTLKTDVLVELDTYSNKETIKRLHIFQTPQPFDRTLGPDHFKELPEASLASPVVETLPEVGEGAVVDQGIKLKNFVEWGVKNYPAKHYMLVIWGHGEGWGAQVNKGLTTIDFTPSTLRNELYQTDIEKIMHDPQSNADLEDWGGAALDYSQKTYLDIPSLRVLLNDLKKNALKGRPIDILANDACLMQMLEVATELSEGARYIIGSSQVQSYLGLPYRSILHELNSGRMGEKRNLQRGSGKNWDEVHELATLMVDLYRRSYDPNLGQQGRHDPEASRSMTLSLVSAEELRRALLPNLQEFNHRLLTYLKQDPMRALDMQYVIKNTPGFLGSARDLGLFLGSLEQKIYEDELVLGPNEASFLLKESMIWVLDSLDKIVLSKVYGSDYSELFYERNLLVNYFKGLTVFLPEESFEYEERRDTFVASLFYKLRTQSSSPKGLWQEWMDLVFLN